MSALTGRRSSLPARLSLPGGIWGFVLRRTLLGLVTLFVVSLVIFAATQALPGDAARAILGRNATPESLATLRHQLHLDQPVTEQYTHWLRGIFTGNLGQSLAANEPVTKLIGKPIENSAFLMLLAAVVSIPLSIVLGSVAARRRDTAFDHVDVDRALGARRAARVRRRHRAGRAARDDRHADPARGLAGAARRRTVEASQRAGPADAALVLAVSPYVARIMRASMVEVLESDYVEMAQLKGLPERVVLWRHALPNGIAPAIQVIALNLAYLAGGIVVVERVFDYPGIGNAFVDAVSNRDLPVIQALAILIAASYVVLNLIADIVTILVSPRLRTSL